MFPTIYHILIGLRTTYFDTFSIFADSKLHILAASRTQNYIFRPLNGLRTTYCGLRTTYLPVENSVFGLTKYTFFALMDSELHIHGFKTTYFDHFADSKLHIRTAVCNSFCKLSVSLVSLHNFTGKLRVRRKYEFRVC